MTSDTGSIIKDVASRASKWKWRDLGNNLWNSL